MGNNDVNGLFCVLLLAGLVPSNLSSLVTKSKTYQLLSQGEIRTFAYLFQCPNILNFHHSPSDSAPFGLKKMNSHHFIPLLSYSNLILHDLVNFSPVCLSQFFSAWLGLEFEFSTFHLFQCDGARFYRKIGTFLTSPLAICMDEIDYGWVQLP